MATQQSEAATRHRWAAAQIAALVVGVAFLLPGVLGFVPASPRTTRCLTSPITNRGRNCLAFRHFGSAQHRAPGVRHRRADFARTVNGARGYLIVSGVIYLLLSIYGLLIDHESAANFVPIDYADNWLHLVLAVGMLGLGAVLGRTRTTS